MKRLFVCVYYEFTLESVQVALVFNSDVERYLIIQLKVEQMC